MMGVWCLTILSVLGNVLEDLGQTWLRVWSQTRPEQRICTLPRTPLDRSARRLHQGGRHEP